MSESGNWDIDSYRAFYESDEHWALKKEFMEAHYDRLPEDRLVCLAQVYVNIELLGCKYPPEVMEELNFLSRGLGQSYREKKKTQLQRTFVKASDAAGAKVRATKGQKRPHPDSNESQTQSSKKIVSFVKAESEDPKQVPDTIAGFLKAARVDNTTDDDQENSSTGDADRQMTVDNLIKSVRVATEHIEESTAMSGFAESRGNVDKYRKAAEQRQKISFTPEVSENQAGRGIGRGKFQSPRGRIAGTGVHSNRRIISTQELDAFMRNNDPLSEFVLVQRVYANCDVPSAILEQSANFSHMPLEWAYDQNGKRCRLSVNGMHVAAARGENKKAAKDAVAIRALEVLIKRCYCLRILKLHSSSEEVSLTEVSDDRGTSSAPGSRTAADIDTPIEDTSIGNKLLKMMGWTGGGLGKDGSGISEPIKPAQIFDRRQGLGHEGEQGVTKIFRSRIRAMIQDYVHSPDTNDLAFSPLFSKEQRAEIHKIARQFRLRSQSHGKGDNRFLILSRKFSPKQLIYQLLQEGPTDKYELLPPERD